MCEETDRQRKREGEKEREKKEKERAENDMKHKKKKVQARDGRGFSVSEQQTKNIVLGKMRTNIFFFFCLLSCFRGRKCSRIRPGFADVRLHSIRRGRGTRLHRVWRSRSRGEMGQRSQRTETEDQGLCGTRFYTGHHGE